MASLNQQMLLKVFHYSVFFIVFSIHEVPSGVLCGMNGANQEQIKGMKNHLKNFRRLCLLLNKDEEKYISYILNIYDAWDDYLRNISKYNGFKNYLDENKIEY